METRSNRSIAEEVIKSAPTGSALNERDVLKWKQTPLVWELSKEVRTEDLPALFNLIKQAEWPVANLATSLIRQFKDDPSVKGQLLSTWKDTSRHINVRLCVMYPLLDYPDLLLEMHKEFFSVVLTNFEAFKAFAVAYWTSPDVVLQIAKDRVNDPRFPHSKHWIYFCNALVSPDKAGAREFIRNYKTDSPFLADVQKALLEIP